MTPTNIYRDRSGREYRVLDESVIMTHPTVREKIAAELHSRADCATLLDRLVALVVEEVEEANKLRDAQWELALKSKLVAIMERS